MMLPDIVYWPFIIGTGGYVLPSPEIAEMAKKLLETAYGKGYESYWMPANSYGARFNERKFDIIERGRKHRWELVLMELKEQRLTAYIDDFETAAIAGIKWLDGLSALQVLEIIRDHLILLPGATAMYQLTSN